MIPESIISWLGTNLLKTLVTLAKKKDEERMRAIIQEEITKSAHQPSLPSTTTINVVSIDILIQQLYELAKNNEMEVKEPSLLGKSSSSTRNLLFYDAHAGQAKLLTTDYRGQVHHFKKYDNWRKSWTRIVPITAQDFTILLFYDSEAKEGKIFSPDVQGRMVELKSSPNWRKSWVQIVPIVARDFTALLFYDQKAGMAKIRSVDAQGNMKDLKVYSDWQKSWVQMISF
jgi:hypothetical protein